MDWLPRNDKKSRAFMHKIQNDMLTYRGFPTNRGPQCRAPCNKVLILGTPERDSKFLTFPNPSDLVLKRLPSIQMTFTILSTHNAHESRWTTFHVEKSSPSCVKSVKTYSCSGQRCSSYRCLCAKSCFV